MSFLQTQRFGGRVYSADGETCVAFAVFSAAAAINAYKAWSGDGCVCDDNFCDFTDWIAGELNWRARYGGPGRWSTYDPVVQSFGKWLLVTQRGEIDV